MARRQHSPFIIDVEASGFGPESYPIEIGLVLSDDFRFCSLIRPLPAWTYWDPKAEEVHNISRDILNCYGASVVEVADQLNELLEGLTLYSDGWVVDKPWLNKLFYAAGREMKFSVSPLEMILKEKQMELWHDTKDDLCNEVDIDRHRASNDAWIVQETYNRTLAVTN